MEKQLQLCPNFCAAGREGRDGFCREPGSAQPQKPSPSSGLEHVEVPLPSRITCCCCGAVACKKFN